MRILYLMLFNTLVINGSNVYSVKLEPTDPVSSTVYIVATYQHISWGICTLTKVTKNLRTQEIYASATKTIYGSPDIVEKIVPRKANVALLKDKIARYENFNFWPDMPQ